jgi:translation initiation factor 1
MDLQDQLKIFSDHEPAQKKQRKKQLMNYTFKKHLWFANSKRKGKVTTVIEGYEGSDADFKILAKEIKTKLSVGGTFKDDSIIIQGDYHDKIMEILRKASKLNGWEVNKKISVIRFISHKIAY